MGKILIGAILAFAIGAACRFFDIPVPAPPKLLGALLVATTSIGYIATDWYMTRNAKPVSQISSGPTGGRP